MPIKVVERDGLVRPLKIWTDDIEDAALDQLRNLAQLPFIHPNGVAAMPDVHAGIGSTVGSVIATHKAIIPAAVGVDIGCGMNAVRLSLTADDLPESLSAIRSAIEAVVPVGAGGAHNAIAATLDTPGALRDTFHYNVRPSVINREYRRAWTQLGTLGGGNHFIELCLDEVNNVWVMLHSGSRGIGNIIGRYYIEAAKREMERWFIRLPDADLAYFPEGSELFDEYVLAVNWAQDYARENRRLMMDRVLQALSNHMGKRFQITTEAINCHHNYVELENHFGKNVYVTRKGAIRAREGDLGIIPGSMGAKSYIVQGKGNPESYCSCSHGAGRRMSRAAARKQFTTADLEAQTQGIECRKDADVIDEIPAAYKDIDEVMANQSDLVEVRHVLRQVMCIKGN